MNASARRWVALIMLVLASLLFAGHTMISRATDEVRPTLVDAKHAAPVEAAASIEETAPAEGIRNRLETIHDLVAEAQTLLRDVELQYVFTGEGKNQVLRGRPVAFALWSETKQEWIVAHIELPRPPIKWNPNGGKPLAFRTLTPGIEARHVKGTGAERLMFAFSRDGDPLKVYGRKFPVFDNTLIKRRQWSAVVETAKPIVYLPFTEDTFDPAFVSSGKEFLITTAHQAIEELRLAKVPSAAFRGELLADVIPPQLIATLAVIEQTDDKDYIQKRAIAFSEVLSQYGLKREKAYRYSLSNANALGPMQFTNRGRNGTYAYVVKRCRKAKLDPVFESGATDLLNAMKAAACLLDFNLASMRPDIRRAYRANPEVLGIFPVAAYNGGSRNVMKLYRVLTRMNVKLDALSRPGVQPAGASVKCPCVWKAEGTEARPVRIPRYNNENRWYIDKYQSIVSLFESAAPSSAFVPPSASVPE
jgi:hypothetical protein